MKKLLLAIFTLSSTQIYSQLADSPWPMFHHDARHTGQSEYAGPSVPKLAWSYETGSITSPALGSDGRVYVGSRDNRLYSLNSDGVFVWSYATADWVYSSPALGSNGRVYFGSCDNNLYVLNSNGVLNWSYLTGRYVTSSPALGGNGMVYVGSGDNRLYSFNLAGGFAWSYETAHGIEFSSPALGSDGRVYIGYWDNRLYSFNFDGVLVWSYETADGEPSPALGNDGRVYFGSEDNRLYSLNSDGVFVWSYATADWVESSPALGSDGMVYVGSLDGRFYSLDSAGKLLWSYATAGSAHSSPALGSDGRIYFRSWDGRFYCIEQGPTSTPTPTATPTPTPTITPTPTPMPNVEGFLSDPSPATWDCFWVDVVVRPLINTFDGYGVIITPSGQIYSFNLADSHSLRKGLLPLAQNVHGLWKPIWRTLFEVYIPAGLTGKYQIIVGLVPAGAPPTPQNAIPRCLWRGTVTINEAHPGGHRKP